MKLFSPDTVNALIPEVTPLIEALWTARRELSIKLLENDPALRAPPHPARPASPTAMQHFDELKAEVVELIDQIEAFGCVVKDVDLGLLDFPALRDQQPVYLCWKAGEPAIAYWHGVRETFVDRKPL